MTTNTNQGATSPQNKPQDDQKKELRQDSEKKNPSDSSDKSSGGTR